MRSRPQLDLKQNERRHKLVTRIRCLQYGAEESGRPEEAADYGALAEEAYEVLGQVWSKDRKDLYHVLSAPLSSVDILKYVAHPDYSPHIDDARVPLVLETYVECRHRCLEVFRRGDARRRSALAKAGIPVPVYSIESVQILMGVLAAYGDEAHELGWGKIPRVFPNEMAARHAEVCALRAAIKHCCAKPRSWQLGHMLMLQYHAGQDLEITPKMKLRLDTVIELRRKASRLT